MRYAALLRGVNVGGRRRVPMADLRALLTTLGCTDVVTHLQSGNAVFGCDETDAAVLERRLRDAVAAELGVTTEVLVRSGGELADVVAANPWPERTGEPAKLHVAFLAAAPEPAVLARLDLSRHHPDEVRVLGRHAYVWYAGGAGRSRLTLTGLRVPATARNWTTVTTLAGLVGLARDPDPS